MITKIWLNGEFVDKNVPRILHDDSGFLRANGVFDSMLAVNGTLVAAREHYDRLVRDCKTVLRTAFPIGFDDFVEIAQHLLKENGINQDHYARVRTQITGGVLKDFLGTPETPTISFSCSRTRRPDNQELIKAWVISDYPRIAGCKLENCKKLDYTRAFAAMQDARAKGGNEPILTNTNGNIACASTSSLFIVEGTNIITPRLEDGILDSISRRYLIRDYSAKEDIITPERLEQADKIFLSNTIRGIRPVIELNGTARENALGEFTDLHEKVFKAA